MIFPSIKILRKHKEQRDISSKSRYLPNPNDYRFESPPVRKMLFNHPLANIRIIKKNYTYLQTSIQPAYKAYSKAKIGLIRNKNKEYLRTPQNLITVPEYSITPEYLNSMNRLSKDAPENMQQIYQNPSNAKLKSTENAFKSKLAEELYTKILNQNSRKTILSKTPDPWTKHINKYTKVIFESDESDDDLIDYHY